MASGDHSRPVVVDRRDTPRGELVLRRAGEHHEVIANGTFMMDTRDGRSERALVREALAGLADARLLLGGLGVGFSLDEAPGGRLAVWASAPDLGFERRLRERFAVVRTVTVDVARGPADVVYVAALSEADGG